MTQPFPPPPIKPFERQQVSDGLMINAERWRRTHEYHRQRQNLHYQSLNQPGIVCGLGVTKITAPADLPAAYRDERWVQIQPGIAIDLEGNPIIIPEPVEFRIASETTTEEPAMVYLIVSYVDPEKLRRKEQLEIAKETYRIDERTNPPGELEVELCRILLLPGQVQLQNPSDVFFPGYNALDLRYRLQARSRPQAFVHVAQGVSRQSHSDSNLSYLLDALSALYPALQSAEKPVSITLPLKGQQVSRYDLIYTTTQESLSLNKQELEEEIQALKSYLDIGGVLLIEASTEKDAVSVKSLAEVLGTPLKSLLNLNRDHPLRTQPFLFAALPELNGKHVQLFAGGGIVLVLGALSAAWGLDDELSLSRSTIRAAQELGINILHFAWRRRQLMQLQRQSHPTPTASGPTSSKPEKPGRQKSKLDSSIFDKLGSGS